MTCCASAMMLFGVAALAQTGSSHIQRQTIERSFPVSPGLRVVIDAVSGSIQARGYAGDEVRVVVREEIRGRDDADLQRALAEIALEVEADDREIRFYVVTPWRDRDGRWKGSQGCNHDFSHDFELLVPYGLELDLHTVMDGDIRVDDVRGIVNLKNVNGGIEAVGIRGISNVRTINGGILLEFIDPPREGGTARTVNGNVELIFPASPNVHVKMETFTGQLFSDFAYTYRDAAPRVEGKREDGMYVYRWNNATQNTMGKGGPQWSLKTLNGNIYIRRWS